MRQVNPRVDIAFKKIFGVEENKDLLVSLVNSIVGEEDQVADVTLLNPYNPKNFRQDKLSILDIKAESQDGKRFNIEIQISDEASYDKRALYYWGKLYTEQLQEQEDYSTLSKAIGIHILNFTSVPESPHYHNVFHVTEKTRGFAFFRDLELHTVELKKFDREVEAVLRQQNPGIKRLKSIKPEAELGALLTQVRGALDMWVAFLTRHNLLDKDHLPPVLDVPELKRALQVVEVMNFGREEREAYEDHLKWLRIEANTLLNYEQKLLAARQGLEETQGELHITRQGLEEAQQGLATMEGELHITRQGLEEAQKKLQNAHEQEQQSFQQGQLTGMVRALASMGLNKSEIAQKTGASLDQVQRIVETFDQQTAPER